ncbi:hypothetical protein BFL38_09820 [Brachyspira hampsonii]|uniref:Beta-lactamase-inhibitor-like PepSY-like domain-containing protein n=1 Tax=Brachyspira hampsonii TaxID=1287055 RepID=A0A1E5NHW8_9SPIR|nr:hypothetical protein [Brachyspira hampsonii]OEJ15755.1 hypothetical protein BFL38_09820 [Brachyspira hampsonii]
MNKKLFLTLFIISILASFSAIGCKNNNTNPDTSTGTDIGEKYQGIWYLNAAPNLQFSPEAPAADIANTLIDYFKQSFNTPIKNEQYTINSDGSILNGQTTIEKNKISKEGDNKYIADLTINIPTPNPSISISGLKEAYTFNTDGQTATAESYIIINIGGKSYNLYVYRDGTFTRTQQ